MHRSGRGGRRLARRQAPDRHPGLARSRSEAREFIHDLAWRTSNGFDLFATWVGEQPGWLVERLRNARAAARDLRPPDTPHASISAIRAVVPTEHQQLFDALAQEALLGYEIRDERGLVTDAWSLGLLRRALRESGTRLVVRGKLGRWEQLSHAEPQELTPAHAWKEWPESS